MTKRRRIKPADRRSVAPPGLPPGFDKPLPPVDKIPNAATFFRLDLVDAQTQSVMGKALSAIKPFIWRRDSGKVDQIKQAQSVEELIALIPQASGLGEEAWHKQMNRFGPEALPLIEKRLKTARAAQNREERTMIYEKLVADLRWRGEDGAAVLMECFDDLDEYGKCLASVVLGLLQVSSSANKLWEFYQEVKRSRESHLVGALWGLIGLGDARACEALVELLFDRRIFTELFGFFSLAGDARAVIPLLWAAAMLPDKDKEQPLLALVSVGHRIGRGALMAELNRGRPPDKPREESEAMANNILGRPAQDAKEYFAIFYRSLRPDDLQGAVGRLL